MPSYNRFEDLPVWQTAIALAEDVEDWLEEVKDRVSWSKRDQIERASMSVSNNIAEGHERGTTPELLAFLYIAKGSAGEVRSMLCYFERRVKLAKWKPAIVKMKARAESCSRQLHAWAAKLQDMDRPGQRGMNSQTRKRMALRKAAEQGKQDFETTLLQHVRNLPKSHPLVVQWVAKHGPVPED
jgi:four helix bundle protein